MRKQYLFLFSFLIFNSLLCNCIAANCVIKDLPLTIIPAFSPIPPICSGQSLAPLPAVSQNGIAGIWMPAVNNTSTTTYTFIPNANQDAASVTMTITVLPNASLILTSWAPSANQIVCANSSLSSIIYTIDNATTATISLGSLPQGVVGVFNNNTYTISGMPTTAGTYNYTVSTEGGCASSSLSGSITVNPASTTELFCDPTQGISHNSVFFDWANIPGATSFQYTYSINNGSNSNGNTAISHYEILGVLPGQSATFTITNVVGVSCFIPISLTCGIPLANDVFETDGFTYYPNPVSDLLNLSSMQNITNIKIFNLLGLETINTETDANKVQVDMTGLTSGIYLVQISSKQAVKTFKVSKN